MLDGPWKNIEELEENVTLEELELRVQASRDREYRLMKFYATFKGVNLDADRQEETQERFDRARRRAEARLSGKTDDELDAAEEAAVFDELGIEFETD